LKFSTVKDHEEPTILLFETLFCMWEYFNMGIELTTKVMLGQTLVLMQMTFLNNVRKVGRLVLSRTFCSSCFHGLESSYPSRCLFVAASCLHLFYQHGYLFNHIVGLSLSIFRYQVVLELEVGLEFIHTL
jgi:hypothetical protein